MKLSIISINFNNKSGLERTLISVITQTYTNFEYIIIDGGSTDGSVELIKEYEDKITYWVSEPDRGIYHAMNKGIEIAKGEYLLFLNSGDCFNGINILNLCNRIICENVSVDIFYGNYIGEKKSERWQHRHPAKLSLMFFFSQTINHQSSVFKKDLFIKNCKYSENYKLAADYYCYLKSFLIGKAFFYIDHPLIIYNFEGQSVTNNSLYKEEMASVWEELVPFYAKELVCQLREYSYERSNILIKFCLFLLRKIKKKLRE